MLFSTLKRLFRKYPSVVILAVLGCAALYALAPSKEQLHLSPEADALPFETATQQLQTLAEDSDAIILTRHAKERMKERFFSLEDVQQILTQGTVEDVSGPDEYNDYRYKTTFCCIKAEDSSIVAVIEPKKVVVITVY